MSRPPWHCDSRISSCGVGSTRAWPNPSYAVVVTTFEILIAWRKQSGEYGPQGHLSTRHAYALVTADLET
jgi:hypothetical protein